MNEDNPAKVHKGMDQKGEVREVRKNEDLGDLVPEGGEQG